LAFLTYRHGFAGVVAGTVILGIVGGMAAGHAWGPFAMVAGHSVEARVLLLQLFVGAGCLLTYPTAVALADRRRLGQELAASKEELQSVADNVPVHIARLDAKERYTFANATLARAIGLDPGQIIGKDIREIRAPEVYSQLAPHIHRALSGEPQSLEFHVLVDGRRIDYRSQFVPDVAPDGTVCGFYSIAMDVSALKQAERELAALARTDALTGLANRRQLEEALASGVARAQRNGQPLMMLVLDIDHFKAINDTYGHSIGDAVIREFAVRLRECVYDVDLAARLGGDEFVVLIEYSPQADVGEAVAQRIVECLRTPISAGTVSLAVSSSIGVGIHFPVRSGERLIELADEALYAAKAAGRATWRLRAG
jgi:diguanylate cyclase (GGDEF)-like protein/PAS domain S-box-containing protein